MEVVVVVLLVLVVVIFVVGVGVGLALSRHCTPFLKRPAQPNTACPLESIRIAAPPVLQKKSTQAVEGQAGPRVVSISAHAATTETPAVSFQNETGLATKRTASMEVGEIYRTASALSIYLDEMESRPHIQRLMSMPSLTDPQRIIDANQINPNIEVHMDEIDLQEQVGKGGYGAVYKGTWRGAVVAVKYAVCNVEDAQSLEQSIREVVLSKKMGHPNVVQTYAWTVLTAQEAAGVALMEDEVEVVKAVLAKTSTAGLASVTDIVTRPRPTKGKGTSDLPRIKVRDPMVDVGDRAEPALKRPHGAAAIVAAEPVMESPFANFQPLESGELSSERRRSGPVEHISPLFERMILESSQDKPHTDGEEPVKRKLGFEAPQRESEDPVPLSIDELLFRDKCGLGRRPVGPSRHAEEAENKASSGNEQRQVELRISVPEGLPALQQLESTAFSDVSSCMLSPTEEGDHFSTPAAAKGFGVGICPAPPRSYLSRASSLGSRSQTPLRLPRTRTPDSFNRHAPPGTSLFDGTEATPQQLSRVMDLDRHRPPRARRRITFDPNLHNDPADTTHARHADRDAPHARTTTAFPGGRAEIPLARQRLRSRSLSPSAIRSSSAQILIAEPTKLCAELACTPARCERDDSVYAESPADTDALLAGHTPSALECIDGACRAGAGTTTPPNGPCELDLQRSGHSLSAHSCASFNSNEGFGSPMAQRNRRLKSLNAVDGVGQGPVSFGENEAMMVVVMEFCDLQSLHRAITKKVFKPHGKFSKQATYRALLRTAQEVAKGMDYIHSFGIIHGDLKPGNVLLKTHRIDRRGYIAKVSDFGLSRPANASDEVGSAGEGLGTISYTAPEIFQDDSAKKTTASDVYAFGILLWEMHHCREVYEGLLEGQICHGVCDGSLRPDFDADCPAELWALMQRCWAQDPGERPDFKQVVLRLTEIEVAFRKDCHMQRPHASGRSRRAVAAGSPALGGHRRRSADYAMSARIGGSVRL